MIDIDGLQYDTWDQMENHHISNQHEKKNLQAIHLITTNRVFCSAGYFRIARQNGRGEVKRA